MGLSRLFAEYMVSSVPAENDAEDLWNIQVESCGHEPRFSDPA